ncbi:MAG TPA: V-type ATP synthase subunit B, partial [Turneriella sp.]|nr:V-type ATP synthase subunit B [Turneriella sp.]
MKKVYTRLTRITKATITLNAEGVGNEEMAIVDGRRAQVVKISGTEVTLQVFAGTDGLATNSRVHFLGVPPQL